MDFLGLAAETLAALLDAGILSEDGLHLHVTEGGPTTVFKSNDQFRGSAGLAKGERPDIALAVACQPPAFAPSAEERVAALANFGRPELAQIGGTPFFAARGEPLVVACGPPELTRAAAALAVQKAWEIHTETFHF